MIVGSSPKLGWTWVRSYSHFCGSRPLSGGSGLVLGAGGDLDLAWPLVEVGRGAESLSGV